MNIFRNIFSKKIDNDVVETKENVIIASFSVENRFLDLINCVLDDLLSDKDISTTVYYAGGTLCMDAPVFDLIMLYLGQTETIFKIRNVEYKVKVPTEIMQKLFDVYLKNKGETSYYTEKYNKFKKELRIEKLNILLK